MEGKKVYEDFKIQLTLSQDEFQAIVRRVGASEPEDGELRVYGALLDVKRDLGIGLYEKEEN